MAGTARPTHSVGSIIQKWGNEFNEAGATTRPCQRHIPGDKDTHGNSHCRPQVRDRLIVMPGRRGGRDRSPVRLRVVFGSETSADPRYCSGVSDRWAMGAAMRGPPQLGRSSKNGGMNSTFPEKELAAVSDMVQVDWIRRMGNPPCRQPLTGRVIRIPGRLGERVHSPG